MSPEWRVSTVAPAASLPMCRVLSSLCRPLLSGLPPASSNSLCSVIPTPHPGGRLDMAWAVCVDSKLGQLHSLSLPCLSSQTSLLILPGLMSRFFIAWASYTLACFKGIFEASGREEPVLLLHMCEQSLPWQNQYSSASVGWRKAGAAAGDGGNGPGGDSDGVSHPAAPSSSNGYSDPSFQNMSQICLPCSVPSLALFSLKIWARGPSNDQKGPTFSSVKPHCLCISSAMLTLAHSMLTTLASWLHTQHSRFS